MTTSGTNTTTLDSRIVELTLSAITNEIGLSLIRFALKQPSSSTPEDILKNYKTQYKVVTPPTVQIPMPTASTAPVAAVVTTTVPGICQAIKKVSNQPCTHKAKPDSYFCGIHKNSKPPIPEIITAETIHEDDEIPSISSGHVEIDMESVSTTSSATPASDSCSSSGTSTASSVTSAESKVVARKIKDTTKIDKSVNLDEIEPVVNNEVEEVEETETEVEVEEVTESTETEVEVEPEVVEISVDDFKTIPGKCKYIFTRGKSAHAQCMFDISTSNTEFCARHFTQFKSKKVVCGEVLNGVVANISPPIEIDIGDVDILVSNNIAYYLCADGTYKIIGEQNGMDILFNDDNILEWCKEDTSKNAKHTRGTRK